MRVSSLIMRLIPCLLLPLLAASAAGVADDFAFQPASVPPQGGAEIQIYANHGLRFTAPQVFFGEVPSPRVTLIDSSTAKVVTPAHAIGIVSLIVLDNSSILRSTR